MPKFCILVVGSRSICDRNLIFRLLDKIIRNIKDSFDIEFVSGGARGVDLISEEYTKIRNYPIHVMQANWNKYGKSAGYIRNNEMFQYILKSDKCGVVIFWDGESRGTKNDIDLVKRYKVKAILYNTKTKEFSFYN